jgi:methylthioribose-1-phosphate isomerase
MKVNGKHYRTIWIDEEDRGLIHAIDQRPLPHRFVIESIRTVEEMARAIEDMHVRGAGLIGAAAAYGMYLAALEAPESSEVSFLDAVGKAGELLKSTRPTAVNLEWAVKRQLSCIHAAVGIRGKIDAAFSTAQAVADEGVDFCHRIGMHGVPLIEVIHQKKRGEPVNILTHCNAGWLGFVDYGTATAPIYLAHDKGVPIHVWVDETRPRNQGARLTAWELGQHGVPHTVVADNTGGHLMQHGLVDLVITGSDRTTYTGDVANKIGTYLKALAANDNGIPFYVALPSSSFDWEKGDGLREIPVEKRDGSEVRYITGKYKNEIHTVLLTPEDSPAVNFAFDVTPSRLITGLITERGICRAKEEDILNLFPEKRSS